MNGKIVRVLALLSMWLLAACPSQWATQGGPRECHEMCKNWGMELTGMVGMGGQGGTGGASACVCELPRSSSGGSVAAPGTEANTSAAVMTLQQQRQQAAAQMQSH